MQTYFRDKWTGEIKEVEQDGQEMRALKAAVGPDGFPRWEQTSFAHADAIKERAAVGAPDEPDLGFEHQNKLRGLGNPTLSDAGVGPEVNPHLALTPGEIEAGLTPQQKASDLSEQFSSTVAEREGVFDEASDLIADERKDPPQSQPARGQTARAGGSDTREGAPTVTAKDDEESPSPGKSGQDTVASTAPQRGGSGPQGATPPSAGSGG